ncbi:MAG: Asp-tRNA(Asn)/Glu-tRNA(Gln) amidotransferase subunit GatB [SAR202 cluster bacterium]|nr:Asp-tRNA(Asn)/Glu-tRNA(Gln) amidotransferase subunit GatB [SAR202 cluster bacterium]
MDYETVIGLEIHAQLLTKSKMFCSCAADYQDSRPNTFVCPICMGMPGVMPKINRLAVEHVVKTGLALNCNISEYSKFDRKNYHYPDLLKAYQISQFDLPLALNGKLSVETDEGQEKLININRIHLEEDTAKLMHRRDSQGNGYTLMDMNRAGVPLMEIVSEPEMNSPFEARSYLQRVHQIVKYVETSSANMEEGNFRCDANISLRPIGEINLGTKVEIKNMNSFRSVFNALVYEQLRQAKLLDAGEKIEQETRGWNEEKQTTFSQRSKEFAHDYRYFPEPDLLPVALTKNQISDLGALIPELPSQRVNRYIDLYDLEMDTALLITSEKATSDFFDASVDLLDNNSKVDKSLVKQVSNWIITNLFSLMNSEGKVISEILVQPSHLVELITLINDGSLSNNMATDVFKMVYETGRDPAEIVKEQGLVQISDNTILEDAVSRIIDENPKSVSDYFQGKEAVVGFFIGQIMRETKGTANPKIAREIVISHLEAIR